MEGGESPSARHPLGGHHARLRHRHQGTVLGEGTGLRAADADRCAGDGINEAQAALATNHEAILGIAALKQLDLIVDGKTGVAYVQPHSGPRARQHNRLGAIFAPGHASDDLVAFVLDGSPAYEAGIRNGDVLLKIGNLDATKWPTDPAVLPLSRFWARPAGDKLDLTLKRGSETLQKTVVLKDILGEKLPASGPKK